MAGPVYSPLAERDLLEIATYIARDKPQAARTFVQTLRDRCRFIAKHRDFGSARPLLAGGSLSSHVLGNYVIYFRRVEAVVEIVRILHAARDHDALL